MTTSKETNSPAQRIEYIDLCKGICIILVVVEHVAHFYQVDDNMLRVILRNFRMPLYFFLSGFFFKSYSGFTFFRKKVNNLLVPFASFYLVTSVLLPILLMKAFHYQMQWAIPGTFMDYLPQCLTKEEFPNIAIWFLLCLLEVNILFFAIYKLCRGKSLIMLFPVSIVGAIGLYLSYAHINWWGYADSACTVLPFFFMGYVLKKNPHWLDTLLTLSCVAFYCIFLVALSLNVDYRSNLIPNWWAYITGASGVMIVMSVGRYFRRIPGVSYLGRYSIIVLCTHALVYQSFHEVLCKVGCMYSLPVVNFLLTLGSYAVIIPFCRYFMPHVTAQKPLFK